MMPTLAILGCAATQPGYPEVEIKIEKLKETVHFLSSIDPPRNHVQLESLKKSADYIYRKFGDYGFIPERQTFEVNGRVYENIIAGIGPSEGERIIVGAHYDVCGNQPGADDNASAVAGLIEIAGFVNRHRAELSRRVDFVAYSLEEPPYFRTNKMGSYFHAKYLYDNKIKVKGMICLEMIGYFTDRPKSQKYPLSLMRLFYPGKGNFIGVVSNFGSSSLVKQLARHLKATSVPVKTLKAPSILTGVDFSDHRNYWKFGYDAVMITDTAFYRNPNYHQTTDTMDTLDFEKMKEVVKGVCRAVLDLGSSAD